VRHIDERANNKHPSRRSKTGRDPLHQMSSPEESRYRQGATILRSTERARHSRRCEEACDAPSHAQYFQSARASDVAHCLTPADKRMESGPAYAGCAAATVAPDAPTTRSKTAR
jgi:hypothetical protein